jgi:hypothetical protein
MSKSVTTPEVRRLPTEIATGIVDRRMSKSVTTQELLTSKMAPKIGGQRLRPSVVAIKDLGRRKRRMQKKKGAREAPLVPMI